MRGIGWSSLCVVVLALSACSGASTDKAVQPSVSPQSKMTAEAQASPKPAPPPGTWQGNSNGKDPLRVKVTIFPDCVRSEDCAKHVVVSRKDTCAGPLTYLGIKDGEWVFQRNVPTAFTGPCAGADLVRWRIKEQGKNLVLANWWAGKRWWKAVLLPA